jgi:hypothetical protein
MHSQWYILIAFGSELCSVVTYIIYLSCYGRNIFLKRSYCIYHCVAGIVGEVIIFFQFDGWTGPCVLDTYIVMVMVWHCANSQDSFQKSTPRYIFCTRISNYVLIPEVWWKYWISVTLVMWITAQFKVLVITSYVWRHLDRNTSIFPSFPKQCWMSWDVPVLMSFRRLQRAIPMFIF